MSHNELWKPNGKIEYAKPRQKQKQKKIRKDAKSKRKQRKEKLRTELISHFRLNKYATNVGICCCINKATDWPIPGKDSQMYSYMRRYWSSYKQGRDFRANNIKNKPKKIISDNEFYASKKWLELRYIVLKKFEGKCCICGASAKDGVQIHVDHIKPRSRYPELQYDLDNLQLACQDCNIGKSNYDDTDFRDWRLLMH